MAHGRVRQPGSVKPEYGPAQVFAFTIGDALLALRVADMNPDPREYHAVCNHFLGVLAAEIIGYYTDDWRNWQRENFKDDYGRPLPPGAYLEKRHRRQEMARAVSILRNKGVLGRMEKDFSDDAGVLAKMMNGGDD